ncbi:hypothetical protein BH23BAC1_BH23BAC1_37290 [soil metagenome]
MVLGGIFILFLIATFLLLTFLEPYAERFIKIQVIENSEGLYTIDFEKININLLTGTIQLQEVLFKPDSLRYQQLKTRSEASETTINIKTSNLKISGIGWLDALIRNQLNIGTINLEQPNITTTTDEYLEINEKEEVDKDIFEDTFRSINVSEIKIPDANYNHYKIQGQQKILIHELPSISLQIFDLELSDSDQDDQEVYVDFKNFHVSVEDYKFQSSNQLYTIKVNHFSYGLEKGELLAENILIDPDTLIFFDPENESKFIYKLNIPAIQITGLDILETFNNSQVQLTNFNIKEPSISILKDLNKSSEDDPINPEEFYEDLSKYLNAIIVEEFNIEDGHFVYQNNFQATNTIHELEGIDFSLHSIKVDSSTIFSPENNFFADDFQIQVDNYSFQHPNNPYKININQFKYSLNENSLIINSLKVAGDLDKNRTLNEINEAHKSLYKIEASNFQVINFNPIEAFNTKKLDIENISIGKINLDLFKDNKSGRIDSDVSLKDIYKDYSQYLTAINIGEIQLNDVSFNHYEAGNHVKQIQKIDHAALSVSGIQIDSNFIYQTRQDIPIEKFIVTAQKYTHWLPDYTFTLNSIQYSSISQQISARALDLISSQKIGNQNNQFNQDGNFYNLSASQFQITGLDIFEIFTQNKVEVDQVLLRQPDFSISRNRDIPDDVNGAHQQESTDDIFQTIDNILINSITIEDGTFSYHEKRDEVIRTQKLDSVFVSILNLHLNEEIIANTDDIIPLEEMTLTAREYTYQSPDKIHELKIDQLQYSSIKNLLNANSIQIISDKEEHELSKAQDIEKANRNLFDISASKFQVTGLDLIMAFETGYFELEQITLSEPEVALLQDQNVPYFTPEAETGEESAQEEALEQISEVVEFFKVHNITINDGKFKLNILKDTITRSQTLEHVSLSIDQLRLVSLKAVDVINMFDMDDVQVLIKDYSYLLPDSLYSFEVGEIKTSLKNQSLSADSLRLIPLFNKEEFADNLEYVQDRFDIVIPEIKMEGVDLREFFNNQNFFIEKTIVENSNLDIYRDNRLEQDPERRPKTLQNLLRQVENSVFIDSLALQGGKITYSEMPPDRDDPISIILENLNLEINNITNDSALIAQNNTINVQGTSKFMGESILEIELILQLDHPEDLYSYEGTLESMDFEAFNNLFENLLFIRIRDGQIYKAEFSVQATEHLAEGYLNFYYNDLDIKFIDRKNPGNPRLRHRIGTWLVNNFLIKSNNPSSRGKFRKGEIQVDRDYQKSVFNHMSSSLLNGVTSSLMPPMVERIYNFFAGD